ncbi:MAG: glucuronate isomerase, partial [Spirochaetales bacterium]|nr:glucuronate isomerase [Spirochaetales bacterium]
LLEDLAALYAEKSWVMQLHLGALRNVNSLKVKSLGANTGFDSMNDSSPVKPVIHMLDCLTRAGKLPKVILYNLNPKDSEALVTGIGNFQDGPAPGKIQYGPAWWFLDQKQGIINQLNVLSSFGLLDRFVGMVTDSRSFLSFPRHEYFRRILCNILGADVEKGELPFDKPLLQDCIEGICCNNARSFILSEAIP